MIQDIKAILLDSGRVMNRPATGHWFIPPNFFQFIHPDNFEKIRDIEKNAAFAQAAEQLTFYPLVRTKEEEFNVFMEYYRIFFMSIPRLKATNEQVEGIARDLVYNPEKYEFIPDALDTIPRLAKSYKLAIVSDAWPSLEDVYTHAGMRGYFSAFILSSQIGVNKPDPFIYHAALDALGVNPQEALFVDDNPQNCDGARQLGIHTALLCRDRTEYYLMRLISRNHPVIHSLSDLPGLLKS